MFLPITRTPTSNEREELYTYADDDPFYSEFVNLIDTVDIKVPQTNPRIQNLATKVASNVLGDKSQPTSSNHVLSDYHDAMKTYELTWRIRDKSEESSAMFRKRV